MSSTNSYPASSGRSWALSLAQPVVSWGSFSHANLQFLFSALGYFEMNGMMPFLKPSNVRQNSLTLKLKYTAFPYKIFVLIKLDILKMLVFESNNNLENIYSFFP